MRNLAALFGASLLAVALLFGSNHFLSHRDARVVTQVIQSSEMTQDVKLHLIKASFKVRTSSGSGTGFAIFCGQRKAESGDTKYYNYVVTCAHVTDGNETVTVEKFHYSNDKKIFASTSYEGKVVLADINNDLALIEVASDTPFHDLVPFVTPTDFKKMRLGEQVWVVGCGLANPPYVSSAGYISSYDNNQIRTTSPIIFGNSGGGCYTIDGKLIGVCRAIPIIDSYHQVYPNNGYCVPVWTVDIWLKISGFGFLNGSKDGSSLDRIFEIRDKAEIESYRIQSERSMKKMLDDLLKKMVPPEPEPTPPEAPKGIPNEAPKGDLFKHRHRDEDKKNRWLFR